MSSLFTMADAITAEAELVNQTWPFVTSRHFEIKGTHARGDSRTEIILFAPLVSNSMRSEWERYSVKNQDWLSESAMLDGAASALEMADEAPTDGHDGHDMGHNEDEAHDGMNHDAGHDGDSNNGMNRDSDMQHVGDTGMEHDSEMQHGGSTGMEHDSGMEHGSGMEHEASGGLEHDSDIEHNASGGMDYGPGMGHEGDGGMQHDSGIEHNVGGGMEHEGNGGVEHDYGMEHNANGGAENDTGIEHEGNGGMEHDSAMDHEASGGMENDPGMDHEGSGNEDNVVEDGATMQHEDNGGMRHGRRHLQMDHGMDHSSHSTQGNDQPKSKTGISEKLYFFADDGKVVRAKDVPLHAPIWQLSPLPKLDHSVVNFDLMMDDSIQRTVNRVVKSALTSSVSEVADFDLFFNSVLTMGEHMTYHSDTHNARHGEFHGHGHPHSVVVAPVKGGFGENSEVVGVVVATLVSSLLRVNGAC